MEPRENAISAISAAPAQVGIAQNMCFMESPVIPQVMNMAINMNIERSLGGDMGKKKRGRPRKYGAEGNNSMALALTPFCSSPSEFSPKRGRGRPPGSGKRQLLAALGEWVANSAGGNFTPHIVTIAAGEDVATKILSFSHRGPRAICILSANGAISNVTLRQPGSSGGTLTYEGRFEILSLSGSFTLTENGGVRSRTGGISVSLAGPDGRVVGGGVAGLLLAASPIQVVVGSFMPASNKEQKRKPNPTPLITSTFSIGSGVPTAAQPISHVNPAGTYGTHSSTLPSQSHDHTNNSKSHHQNQNSNSFHTAAAWPSLASTAEERPSPDINVCLPGE